MSWALLFNAKIADNSVMKRAESHFKEQSVYQHLKSARKKGKRATHESHGINVPDHLIAGADAAKEASVIALLIWIVSRLLAFPPEKITGFILITLLGYMLWRSGRSAILGWARLQRINRLISEESHEIHVNRDEERSELKEIYRAKGFTGEMLEKVIDVLMADDNKLLGIMLEEELGVSLESYEHPLKLALGALVGIALTMAAFFAAVRIEPGLGVYCTAFGIILIASGIVAKVERINFLTYAVWNLGITFLSSAGIYFLAHFLLFEAL